MAVHLKEAGDQRAAGPVNLGFAFSGRDIQGVDRGDGIALEHHRDRLAQAQRFRVEDAHIPDPNRRAVIKRRAGLDLLVTPGAIFGGQPPQALILGLIAFFQHREARRDQPEEGVTGHDEIGRVKPGSRHRIDAGRFAGLVLTHEQAVDLAHADRAAGQGVQRAVLAGHQGAGRDRQPIGAGIIGHVKGRARRQGLVGPGRVGPARLAVDQFKAFIDRIAESGGAFDCPAGRQTGLVQRHGLRQGRAAAIIPVLELYRIAVFQRGDRHAADRRAAHQNREGTGFGHAGIAGLGRGVGRCGRVRLAAGGQGAGQQHGQDRTVDGLHVCLPSELGQMT